jgi:hypothetical protein
VFAWLDRRRAGDATNGPVDVWAGSWDEVSSRITPRLVTQTPVALQFLRLANGPTGPVAVWVRDAGSSLELDAVPLRFPWDGGVIQSQPLQGGPVLGVALSGNPAVIGYLVRGPAGGAQWGLAEPLSSPQALTGPIAADTLVALRDGGLVEYRVVDGGLSAVQVRPPLNVTPVTGEVSQVFSVPGRDDALVTASTTSQLGRMWSDGGLATFNLSPLIGPALVTSVGNKVFSFYRISSGPIAGVALDTLANAGSVMVPSMPVALGGGPSKVLLVDQTPAGPTVRVVPVTISGLGGFAPPSQVLTAAQPQLNAAAAYSALDSTPTDTKFLMTWDERLDGGWVSKLSLVDHGGSTELNVSTSDVAPWQVVPGISVDGGRVLTSRILPTGRKVATFAGATQAGAFDALDEVVVAGSTYLTWSTTTPEVRLGTAFTWNDGPLAPGCVHFSAGSYRYLMSTAASVSLVSVDESGTRSTLPMPYLPPTAPAPCFVQSSAGPSATVALDGGVKVYPVITGGLVSPVTWTVWPVGPLSQPPVTVPAPNGVLVIAPLVADGEIGRASCRERVS